MKQLRFPCGIREQLFLRFVRKRTVREPVCAFPQPHIRRTSESDPAVGLSFALFGQVKLSGQKKRHRPEVAPQAVIYGTGIRDQRGIDAVPGEQRKIPCPELPSPGRFPVEIMLRIADIALNVFRRLTGKVALFHPVGHIGVKFRVAVAREGCRKDPLVSFAVKRDAEIYPR